MRTLRLCILDSSFALKSSLRHGRPSPVDPPAAYLPSSSLVLCPIVAGSVCPIAASDRVVQEVGATVKPRQPEVISCRRGIGCVIVSRVHPASRTTFIRIIPGVRYDSNRFYHGYSAQRQLYIFPFLLSLCLTCLFYLSGTSVTLLAVMGSRYKKTGKVFPAGVVSLASLIMASGYLHGILRSSKTL
ncbi:hypothetical protein B296_00049095 [Ensete ventricosum]|uniref:Uncharacterized protein n=1 Tax=Ensete ventricosum TaxID=4639 RepID=A0A426YAE1_ENSVE|nr:hypothetical protein B296_00049095 [Ensete ventricosum]